MNGIRIKIQLNSLLVFLIFAVLTGVFWHTRPAAGALILIILETAVIVKKAGFSFFSVFSILINYCFIMEYLVFHDQYVYGLLGLGYVKVYYFEMFLCCSLFNLILIFFIDVWKISQMEKDFYQTEFCISSNATRIYCIIAIAITVLIFPSIPGTFLLSSNRFSSGILSFAGWSCIPFFFAAISILGGKVKKTVFATVFFILLWYVLHGERVEAMGLIVFIVIWFFNTANFSLAKKLGILGAGITSVLALTAIGIIRTGGKTSFSKLLTNLLIQTTACDVTNVFNCAVDLYQKGGSYHGMTYLSYVVNCIPYVNDPYSFSRRIIADGYRSAGGGLFLAEPFANGGIVMIAIETFLFLGLFYWLVKKKSIYRTLILIELFLSVFRIAWYGLNYPIVTIVYFVPFAVVVNKLFLSRERRQISIEKQIRRSRTYS